ncbi:hypothetical protein [Streptomyces sioyaensis]|uniref:hypothetical protein n=1 Tax=Streptomyces sioyaensis TaxID=67364 RepID=UPI00379BB773
MTFDDSKAGLTAGAGHRRASAGAAHNAGREVYLQGQLRLPARKSGTSSARMKSSSTSTTSPSVTAPNSPGTAQSRSEAERLSYHVLLPALFLHSLATAGTGNLPVPALAGTLVASTVAVAVLVIAFRPMMRLKDDGFTSVFQGSIRFNNYIGVTIAAGLYGTQGVATAAVCNAVMPGSKGGRGCALPRRGHVRPQEPSRS